MITSGEGLTVEFKESKNKLNRDVFETVCSFLNRQGGDLFLGVNDNGELVGVHPDQVMQIKREFTTTINNPTKLSPTFYLMIEEVEIDEKLILHILVPESSEVHRCNGRIYDRNQDGDFDITNNTMLVAEMYIRKQRTYTVNEVFPYAGMEELRPDLIQRVRTRANNMQLETHPWMDLTDSELVRNTGLFGRDFRTGKEGVTLAGILLFGRDDVIQSVLPHHRTDALLRIVNVDRYDDRNDVRTNLMESFERLTAFCVKHLNDPFYLEGNTRISLRDKIIRELVANTLIHREYSRAFTARLVIEKDQLFIENANRPHGYGQIDVNNFTPLPKNPVIAKMFREIGFADDLGSGVRNTAHYLKLYSGKDPLFEEGDIFRVTIPLIPENLPQGIISGVQPVGGRIIGIRTMPDEDVTPQVTPQVTERQLVLLEFCNTAKSRPEIMAFLKLKDRKYVQYQIIRPLIDLGLLRMTLPDMPSSPLQKYQTTGSALSK